MKRLLLSFLLLSGPLSAQDSISTLFLGNSYTGHNNLPLMIATMADSMGDVLIYDSRTPGGYTLYQHADDPGTYTKINDKLWDRVVIQAQSQEPSFPDNQVNT